MNINTEDLTMFDERTREYLRRASETAPAVIDVYRTGTCPECEETVAGEGVVMCDGGEFAHVTLNGAVILGCEGYWVVDPAALGMDCGAWEDWRADA